MLLEMMFLFVDRSGAGEQLAARLLAEPLIKEAAQDELLVLSIPRGGVVVGATVAQALGCAHEVIIVKKISFPGYQELAIGAMAEDGLVILNHLPLRQPRAANDYIGQEQERVKAKLQAYVKKFRKGKALEVQSKTVIVVDDGIATGETMKAAVSWLTSKAPGQRQKKLLLRRRSVRPARRQSWKRWSINLSV